jgi:simple sugar transport system permease protein
VLCSLPRVNDVATGIALMLLGTGLAFYLGKPLIQPQAAQLPPLALGGWSGSPVVQAALQVNPLLPLGIALAIAMRWGFARTRWGLLVRLAAIRRARPRRSATRSTASASPRRSPAARSPASAAPR